MARPNVTRWFDSKWGFTQLHWYAILEIAGKRQLVLLFRAGKEVAIRWIERGFAAKEMSLKMKVDPHLGLLIARSESERLEVARRPLAVAKVEQISQLFRSFSPQQPRETHGLYQFEDLEEGVVAHSVKRLPFTSDYDLAAIVPQAGELRYLPAMMSEHKTGDSDPHLRPQVPGRAMFSEDALKKMYDRVTDPKLGFSNSWVAEIARELNSRFGDERIVHGPQALYVKPMLVAASPVSLSEAQLASGDKETIVAFCPDGGVDLWYCETVDESRRILSHYLPKEGQLAGT